MMRAERDSQPLPENEVRYRADPRLFLPAVVIAVLYGSLWLSVIVTGRGGTAFAQALLAVIVVAVPVLLVRGWLRYRSLELRVAPDGVRYTKGLLRPVWQEVPVRHIRHVRTLYGPAGRRFGTGALLLVLEDGARVRIADLADLDDAAERIRALREEAR